MVRSFALTTRGVGFVAAAVGTFVLAPILSVPALLYATGLLLGLVLLAGIFVAVGHSRVRIDRQFTPHVVDPGQVSRASVTVTNTSSVPCPEAVWSDHLPFVVAGEPGGVLPALGPAGTADARVSATYTMSSSTRGPHQIGPLGIRTIDPFGLVERRRTFGQPHHLTVLPRRYDLRPIRPRGSDEDGATRPAPQQVGLGEDDVIARAYAPGDALKRLHWKATARRGELMVRQEEQQMNPRASVLLDLDARAHGTTRDGGGQWEYSPSLEWSVAAAASMVTHLVRAGYLVTTASPDGSVDAVVAEGRDTLRDVLISLAECEATQSDAWQPAAERVCFVVTGTLDVRRAEQWAQALAGAGTVHAMVAAGTRTAALDVLHAAGWHAVTFTPQSDIPETWDELDGSRHHVAR